MWPLCTVRFSFSSVIQSFPGARLDVEALLHSMPDDIKQSNVVVSRVHVPWYVFAFGYHGAEFGHFIGVAIFATIHNLSPSSDK